MAGASAASLVALSVVARDQVVPMTAQTDAQNQQMYQDRVELLKHTARASEIIGMAVENLQDQPLGKVDNLALDVESGRIVQVIIATGGYMGVHSVFTAVPPGKLHREAADQVLRLDMGQPAFAAAPKFDYSHWDAGCQSNRVAEVYAYFQEQPYFVTNRDGYWTGHADGTFTQNRRPEAGAVSPGATVPNEVAKRAGEDVSNTIDTQNPDGTKTREYYSSTERAISTWSKLGYTQEASKLIGMPIRNLQDQKLGHVENFILDLSAGRIAAVRMSSHGFLGANVELSAAPPTEFRFNADHDVLLLDATPENLLLGGDYNVSEWPNFVLPFYHQGVYYPYKVQPYNHLDAPNRTVQKASDLRHDLTDSQAGK